MTPAERSIPEVLRAAADLIEPEGAWTQGWAARTMHGDGVSPLSENARCWCAWGALEKVTHGNSGRAFSALVRVTGRVEYDPSQWGEWWNDATGRTQDEVVAALHAAADLYEATHNPGETL